MCLPPRDEVAKTSADANKPQLQRPPFPCSRQQSVVEFDGDHVTFREEDQIHLVPTALSCLEDDQDRHDLWYNREDIRGFRRQAQMLSKKGSEGTSSNNSEEECTRGLELRMSLQRQDRKRMIVKRILDAQDDDCTPEEIGQIAQKHSIWSRKLALAQAHKDYYAAYHPNLTSVLPEMPAMLDCSRDVITNKRSLLLGSSMMGRRVRCRMY